MNNNENDINTMINNIAEANKILSDNNQDNYLKNNENSGCATDSSPFTNMDNDEIENNFKIKIIGIGGAGCNVIKNINNKYKQIKNVATLYAFNTDKSSLKLIDNVANRFLLDKQNLHGYGSGGDPKIGKQAVLNDAQIIENEIKDTDILFIIAGMGKGTGSGGSTELAKIAKKNNILTVGIINLPSLACEGNDVYNNACENLKNFSEYCDSITIISNEKVISESKDISFYHAYELANDEIANIIKNIIDIIFKPTDMNIDFSDIRNFFLKNKYFLMSNLTLDNSNINKDELEQKIRDSISLSNADVDYIGSKWGIINITMSKNTSNNFIKMVKTSFSDILQNNFLNLVTGIGYYDEDKVDFTYLIAGNLKNNFLVNDIESKNETNNVDTGENNDDIFKKLDSLSNNENNDNEIG